MGTLWKTLTRRKVIHQPEVSNLGRVLGTFDLTFLGIGATLGVGLYVLVGKVARETAGPSIIFSFLIAAIASAFAGLCYAEFGARVPRAGSAYIYSYVCVGEFIAFIIGWNLILEYVIGSASVAHGMSLYVDALANDSMKNAFTEIAPINVKFLADYFDFFAFSVAIILSIFLAVGVKESTTMNNIITCLNLAVVGYVIIGGATKADINNWKLEPGHRPGDKGGFFPFGINGMIKGAATCFYGFIGFDCIATTGEEAKNPQRAIPLAIILSLALSFLAYFGVSTVITLMVPYYDQDINSPIPFAFEYFDMTSGKWIVTLGGCFALCASLFGAMFPLPRIVYAMANDGVIFRFLGIVNKRFSTPLIGTILTGILTGIIGGLFDQGQLVDMMSIGTLLAYTIVAACVLILRYSDSLMSDGKSNDLETSLNSRNVNQKRGWIAHLFNIENSMEPTKRSEKLVTIQVFVYCILCIVLGLLIKLLEKDISNGELYAIILASVVALIMVITLISLAVQPQSSSHLAFKVPLVPLIPALSILVNIYLMMSLDVATWIRFGVWMAIGLPIYIYSVRNNCFNGDNYQTSQLGCSKARNMSEGSTYVNFGYINGEAENVAQNLMKDNSAEVEPTTRCQQANKSSADSDSGAYFDENENTELEHEELETNSVREVFVTFDTMLEKEEEKCGECSNVGLINGRNRSVSVVSSVSNNSCNLPREESVIAIIHREDEPEIILEQPEPDDSEDAYEANNTVNEDITHIEIEPEDIEDISEPINIVKEDIVHKEVEGSDLIAENVVSGPETNQNQNLPVEENVEEISPVDSEEDDKNAELEAEKDDVNESTHDSEMNDPNSNESVQTTKDFTQLQDVKDVQDVQNEESVVPKPENSEVTTGSPPTPPAPPPPPPPSMTQFELYKTVRLPPTSDFVEARNALKKTSRPSTPPPTPMPKRAQRKDSQPQSTDNLKLTSEAAKNFKSKLEMNLGHLPKNLKFTILPAPNYYTVHRKSTDNAINPENDALPKEDEDDEEDNGVIDESLYMIDKDEIKRRLNELLQPRLHAPQDDTTKRTVKSILAEKTDLSFGETGA